MSEILNVLDVNDYGLQSMKDSGGGGEAEDLTIELGAQDTALSTQQSKIDELESALNNKIALDLADATSDADATAGDIAKNKTAYVNGVKLNGTLEVVEKVILPDGTKFTNSTSASFMWLENTDTTQLTSMVAMFDYCINLTSIPQLDVTNITDMHFAFRDCRKLSNESLNNILAMCANSAITDTNFKTLKYIGLTSAKATICQTLSNWDAFVAAGWTSRILERRNKKCQQEQIKKEYLLILKLYQKITQI